MNIFIGIVPIEWKFHRLSLKPTSTPARGRGRGRDNGRPIRQRIIAHTVATKVESRGPARDCAIREPNDQDLNDVIAGTFNL